MEASRGSISVSGGEEEAMLEEVPSVEGAGDETATAEGCHANVDPS